MERSKKHWYGRKNDNKGRRKKKEYRYYIVVQSNKVDMILVKSNKNLVSELGYFHNEDDCKMVINKYQRELLECIG